MTQISNISLIVSIVCYHSSHQELLDTLSTLLTAIEKAGAGERKIDSRIFLVDNSENHLLKLADFSSVQEAARNLHCELRLLQGHGNIGYGGGHNLAIRASATNYHLLLNPDVELDENALLEGIRYLETHPSVVVVSPAASASDGSKQYLCKRYPSVLDFLARGFLPARLKKYFRKSLARFEMHDLPEDHPSDSVPLVSGCFMLCRSDALQAVQGFDENYFMYFEDFDLSLRLGRQGKLAYLPAMKIRHHGGNSSGKGLKHILMFIKSGLRFFNRYGWRLIQ